MESGRKRSGADHRRGWKRAAAFLVKNRRALVEAVLIAGLLVASMTAYLVFRGRDEEGGLSRVQDPNLRQAILQYRMESYDRARVLLLGSLESAPRRERSTALLYLGNIDFRRGRYRDALDRYLEAGRLDRKNPHAPYNAALAACREGRWMQARELAQRALHADPGYGPALLLLGNLHAGSGSVEEAAQLYARAGDFSPLARYNLARSRAALGHAGEAAGLLLDLAGDRDTPRALRGLGWAALAELTGERDPVTGAAYLGRALEVFPSLFLRYNQAALLAAAGRHREAERLLSAVRPEEGISRRWGMLLNAARFMNGRYRESLRGFQELYRAGSKELARIVGDLHLKLGELREAERMYRDALQVGGDPGALANLVRLLLEEGRHREALEVALDFAGRHEGPDGRLHAAEVYFDLGDREQGLGAMRLAEERARSTAQLLQIARVFAGAGMPDHALRVLAPLEDERARLALAGLYRDTGHLGRASRVLEQLRQRTADPDTQYRATLLLASISDQTSALRLYRELVADFPYRYQPYHNAALLLLQQGEPDTAAAMVRDCIAASPGLRPSTLSDLYVILGSAQFHGGDTAGAVRAFRKAARLDPENDLPAVNLQLLGGDAEERDKRL
ncbi:MAG: tetratricopeptide repeat protein [Spirochaetota bacterium]